MEETKLHIKECVEAYKYVYPEEYKATIEQVSKNRKQNINQTGDITKLRKTDMLERPLHEIPITLFTIFNRRLTPEEIQWFGTSKGAGWFAKTFPEFSRVEKV